MSIFGAFQIGRTGLTAAQIGIQIAGNNLSNASTPGYSRQVGSLVPIQDQSYGPYSIGRGVGVSSIRRQVDTALQQRLWSGTSQQSSAQTNLDLLSGVESTLNALSDTDLSSQVGKFFNTWSQLANTPNDSGVRTLVVQQGRSLSDYVRTLRSNLVDQRTQIDATLNTQTSRANDLLSQIASLNTAIVTAENGGGANGGANALRDQRDSLVTELSNYMDVTPVEQLNGNLDILVGSTPVVLAGQSRGVTLSLETVNGQTQASIRARDNDEKLDISAGSLGALITQRTSLVTNTINRLDTLTSQIIYQVNKAHSVGYGTSSLTDVTGTTGVGATDINKSFNDPTNATFAALPFAPTSGSFNFTITNSTTGSSSTSTIHVDLDGITNANTPGYTDDTSLATIRAAIQTSLGSNGTASITSDGKLKITMASGYTMGFSEDTSGVLATLGVNTYFTGKDATDIGVRSELVQNSGLLSGGSMTGGQPNDNGAAMAISGLRDVKFAALGTATFQGHWDQTVGEIGVQTGAAKTTAAAATTVVQSLDAQRSAVSGVSVDEESISLITYQRQYQASAKFISTINDITQTLLGLVR